MKKLVAECLGTFIMVFCGTGAMVVNEITGGAVTHPGVAITWGLIVTAMIYVFGSISGAHINPAVSIGFSLTKAFDKKLLLGYIIAQLIGAFIASIFLYYLFPTSKYLGSTLPLGSGTQSFIIEILLTFFLMLSIIFVSQNKDTRAFTGIVVGAVVGLEAMFAGPITGASMNPARSIAPAIISGNTQHLWIYIAAPIIGSLLAIVTWIYFQKKKVEEK